jgi:hypothetical protein
MKKVGHLSVSACFDQHKLGIRIALC